MGAEGLGGFERDLRAFSKKIEDIAQRASALDGHHNVPASELFTPEFMRAHSRFVSFEAMVEASPWAVDGLEDFAAIPDGPWDEYVAKSTSFPSWAVMKQAAAEEWAVRKLGL